MNAILILRCNNAFSTIFFEIRVCNVNVVTYCGTAKRILERLGIQTSTSFLKFDRSVFLILKPISLLFWHLYGLFFLSSNYWCSIDLDQMASISVLAGI